MPKAIDYSYLIGQRFGKLIVLSYNNELINGRKKVKCLCDCGNVVYIRVDSINTVKSCGCIYKTPTGENNTSYIDGRSNEKLYGVWHTIKARINNKNHDGYFRYGGRGIKMCDEWYDYAIFRKWAFWNGYNEKLTIERINNDGDYEPANCKWATIKEQCQNRRSSRFINYLGQSKTLRQWCDELNLKFATESCKIYRRFKKTGEFKLSIEQI